MPLADMKRKLEGGPKAAIEAPSRSDEERAKVMYKE